MSCPCGSSFDGQVCPDANGRPLCADAPSPPVTVAAMLAQAWADSRRARAEAPQAAAERRCAKPPMGCGQPLRGGLSGHFRDQRSRAEYDITGLCQLCQDEMFRPDFSDLLTMAADEDNYARCPVCGEWRELEHVDVGIGVMFGHDCCAHIRFGDDPRPPRCTKTGGCSLAADHQYNCDQPPYDVPELDRLKAWLVEQGHAPEPEEDTS